MRLVKFAVKAINPELLMEEMRPLGITSASFVGFEPETREKMVPVATRTPYASTTVGGVTTRLFADPGEMHLEAASDPGVSLETTLAAHDFSGRSSGQQGLDAETADRATVQAAVDSGRSMSDAELKAMGRIVLRS